MKRAFAAWAMCAVLAGHAFAAIPSPAIESVEPGESSCVIKWAPAPEATGYNVYMKTETGRYQKLNTSPLADTSVRLVDLANGMPYRFAVSAVGRNGEESAATVTQTVMPTGYGYRTVPVKGGRGAGDYILFSTPFARDGRAPKDVFSYLPPYQRNRWRIFSMDKDGYHEYADIPAIEPGKGYWFISAGKTDLFLSGKTAGAPVSLRLQPGWNLIGSPYLFPVEWREVLDKNPDAARFMDAAAWEFGGGEFHKIGSLLPFHGYLVHSSSSEDIAITIPPVPAAPKLFQEQSPVAQTNGGDAGAWMMRIAAFDGTFRDGDNYIGFRSAPAPVPTAPEPPAWPQHLSLYFTRKDEAGKRFSSDLRHSVRRWIAVVEGGQNDVVTISWKVLSGTPKAVITDLANHRKTNMAKYSAYTFTRENGAPRTFLITER